MPELYLMRHAKAKRARGDMTEHQRPLRKRGRRHAAAMAQALQRPAWPSAFAVSWSTSI